MSVDIKDERPSTGASKPTATPDETAPPAAPRVPLAERARVAFSQIKWFDTLLIAFGLAVAWCVLFLATTSTVVQILAGILPVSAGLLLGRRTKQQYLLHGILMGLCSFLMGFGLVALYAAGVQFGIAPLSAQATQIINGLSGVTTGTGSPVVLLLAYSSLSFFPLIPFPAFGTVMSGRSDERNKVERERLAARGGRLERPGTIRTADDLTGLSLPQLGHYVAALFKKKGFTFKDYRFADKDRILDMWLEYESEQWWLRLSVADKVRPGTVESLVQDMRKQNVRKGMVITNTEFTPDALKAGKSRRSIVLVDGPTLFSMAES